MPKEKSHGLCRVERHAWFIDLNDTRFERMTNGYFHELFSHWNPTCYHYTNRPDWLFNQIIEIMIYIVKDGRVGWGRLCLGNIMQSKPPWIVMRWLTQTKSVCVCHMLSQPGSLQVVYIISQCRGRAARAVGVDSPLKTKHIIERIYTQKEGVKESETKPSL